VSPSSRVRPFSSSSDSQRNYEVPGANARGGLARHTRRFPQLAHSGGGV